MRQINRCAWLLLCALVAGTRSNAGGEGSRLVAGDGSEVLKGTIVDRAGRGIARATLVVYPGVVSDGFSARFLGPSGFHTDDAGRFEVVGLKPGQYTIAVSHNGYVRRYVTAQVPTAGFNATLATAGHIVGVVRDQAGKVLLDERKQPLRVDVHANWLGDPKSPEAARHGSQSNGDGRYDIELPAGRYAVGPWQLGPDVTEVEVAEGQTVEVNLTVKRPIETPWPTGREVE